MSPGHLPDWTLMTSEVSSEGLGPVTNVEYLDGPVTGARGQSGPVEVHLGVMNHVLVTSVNCGLNSHHPDIRYD